MAKKPKTTKPGTVQKIIKPFHPRDSEKAEIAIEGADHLWREIRIENTLEDEAGHQVRLKKGASVEVSVEAEPTATTPKADTDPDDEDVPPSRSQKRI